MCLAESSKKKGGGGAERYLHVISFVNQDLTQVYLQNHPHTCTFSFSEEESSRLMTQRTQNNERSGRQTEDREEKED